MLRRSALVLTAIAAAVAAGSSGAQPSPISATEGTQFSGQVGTVTASCSNPSQAQATIAWGDGSSSTATVTNSGAQLTITGSHTYAEEGGFAGAVSGSYTCTNGPAPQQFNFGVQVAATVADAPLTVTSGPHAASLTAGHSFTTTVASFADADPAGTAGDYTTLIDWGDGHLSMGTVTGSPGSLAVGGGHAYASAGRYTVKVRIYDHGGAKTAVTGQLTVAPGPMRVGIRVEPRVGNGTAVLSLRLTRPGRLRILPVRRKHTLLLAGRRIRVAKAGPLVVILRPTLAARRLLRRVHKIHVDVEMKYVPIRGQGVARGVPLVLNFIYCDSSITYLYTASENSCIVPNGVHAVKVIAVGGRGGNVSEPCGQGLDCPYSDFGGPGGRGAIVTSGPLAVQPGQTLYIEVGGNGGDTYANPQLCCGTGQAGAGGWNGGGAGQMPSSGEGSGGGGGASDVQTLSCANLCDQGLGLGALIALASRVVIAGGGGGGGSGGGAGDGGGGTQGGSGGNSTSNGFSGGQATVSGNEAPISPGGGGASYNSGGAGGAGPTCGGVGDGNDGLVGPGGAGGDDTQSSGYIDGYFINGYAGGGGGGGYSGGGGGSGGCISLANTVRGGGGGGGGSSSGPPGTTAQISAPGTRPYVQVIPIQ